MEVLRWEMQQQQATTPSRIGRSGLKPGKKAPEFKLSTAAGPEIALSDFAGRSVREASLHQRLFDIREASTS
jgi:hypothetical protein